MALTLEEEQRLERASLVAFFTKHIDKWQTLAARSYKFVSESFPEGATVRPDDVAKALEPLLQVNKSLIDCLNTKKLKQKYWFQHFCDLIIDRTWSDISN
jgi:hypothetical protein